MAALFVSTKSVPQLQNYGWFRENEKQSKQAFGRQNKADPMEILELEQVCWHTPSPQWRT
jgi:hypothetical protein